MLWQLQREDEVTCGTTLVEGESYAVVLPPALRYRRDCSFHRVRSDPLYLLVDQHMKERLLVRIGMGLPQQLAVNPVTTASNPVFSELGEISVVFFELDSARAGGEAVRTH